MWTRTYLTWFTGGLGAYALVLFFTINAFERHAVPNVLKIPIALLPMIPLVVVTLAVVGAVRASDELQSRIQFEALSFAFAFTALTTFSYGFLEIYAGFPHLNMFSVWPTMAAFWLIGLLLAKRRYA
jgi:hypothetical protein